MNSNKKSNQIVVLDKRTIAKKKKVSKKQKKHPVSKFAKVIRKEFAARRNFGSFVDSETTEGFMSLLQTLFSGTSGIHRGLCLGAQTTGLCRFKQVVDFTVPAGTYLTYAWAPVALTNGNIFTYASGIGATFPVDPYNSTAIANITSASLPGPFTATNPSIEWRVVRAAMRVTPEASVLNQGGVVLHAYCPEVYAGTPSPANLIGLVAGAPGWTAANFENFEFLKTFSGTQQSYTQWFPNDDEIYIEPASSWNSTTTPLSGFVGYIYAPTTAVQYHLEFDYGIEYVPNTAYRPYVDRDLPLTHPNAYYELNKYIMKHWDEAVIATVAQHDYLISTIEHLGAPKSVRWNMANQVSDPSIYHPINVEATLYDKMCGGLMDATGSDICGIASGSLKGMANNAGRSLINSIVAGNNPMYLD